MDPAYQIVLSDAQLAILGEITVILGQIDEEMIRTVSGLIGADRETAQAVMGSTRMENNSDIWSRLIQLRNKDNLDILWAVGHAMSEFPAVQQGRNDFIHADFGVETVAVLGDGTEVKISTGRHYETYRRPTGERVILGFTGPIVAKRIRSGRKTPIAELHTLRDQAARLSCLVAHIGWAVSVGQGKPHTSPWHDRLAPTLPPRPDDWKPGKAKAQQAQRKPSQKSRQPPPPRPAEE